MLRRLPFCVLGATALAASVSAQTPDSLARRDSLRTVEGQAVVVTGSREARALADVAVPTTVVTKQQMRAQGALRLADVLAEQPGMSMIESIGGGSGLQLAGFSPDYTLILIDGEPVIGRVAGTLDLNRLAVAGIERVEVVRGPSSSRYGSEALAGVVNLVTRRPGDGMHGSVSARAESHATYDLTAEGETGTERFGVRVLLNRLSSDGFDLLPDVPGASSPRFSDYTAEARLRFEPLERTRLGLTARVQTQSQSLVLPLDTMLFDQRGERTDYALTGTLRQRFGTRWVLDASLHGARFLNDDLTVAQTGGAVFDSTSFDQGYAKAEASVGYVRSAQYAAYAGGGWIGERVAGDRYADAKSATQAFGFTEMQWMPSARWDVNASVRFDAPSDYAARFSPKIAVLYKPTARGRVRASLGSGYKAPAFRQRYLSFTNAAAGGYSVFGAEEVVERLNALVAAGGITQILIPVSELGSLRAESNLAFTAGVEWPLLNTLTLRVDAFRHRVRDLIETQAVAVKTNGQSVFSYFNRARVRSTGVETGLDYAPTARLRASASYQFLRIVDLDVAEAIDRGEVYWRDANYRDRKVSASDYGSLIGRSPHSGTVRLDYQLPDVNFLTSLRVIWRGPYAYRDADGNRVGVGPAEHAPGYALVNVTVTRAFGRADVQLGLRNLLNRTDAERLPGQPGRTVFVGARYAF